MMSVTIAILDYGMGNLRSVQKAFEAVGHAAVITADVTTARAADKLVLPGVGAFRDAIAKLRETGLDAVVMDHIASGRPFLGICLGLQLLFEKSHEDGVHEGLGILAGDVIRFEDRPGIKVPHMGWNRLENCRGPLFADQPAEASVYFVHSYYAVPRDASVIAATASYPQPFCAAVWRGNLMATQFHPEKSQAIGLAMLKRFADEFRLPRVGKGEQTT
jgi:imidazole glycerol-phosphate synthase subunit HisH